MPIPGHWLSQASLQPLRHFLPDVLEGIERTNSSSKVLLRAGPLTRRPFRTQGPRRAVLLEAAPANIAANTGNAIRDG